MKIDYVLFECDGNELVKKINEFVERNHIRVISIDTYCYINRYRTKLWYEEASIEQHYNIFFDKHSR